MNMSSSISLPSIANNTINTKSLSITTGPEFLTYSYSNLDPPFGLEFTRDRSDIVLGAFGDVESDEELSPASQNFNSTGSSVDSRSNLNSSASGYRSMVLLFSEVNSNFLLSLFHRYRPGGPKEARLKKVALLSKTKDVDHLYPIKLVNLPADMKPEALATKFSQFGKVEDVYIPTDLKTKRNRDFAVIRYANKPQLGIEDSTSDGLTTVSIENEEYSVSPLRKQPIIFTRGTGALGITNEAYDDGSRQTTAKPPPQSVPLSSWFALR